MRVCRNRHEQHSHTALDTCARNLRTPSLVTPCPTQAELLLLGRACMLCTFYAVSLVVVLLAVVQKT